MLQGKLVLTILMTMIISVQGVIGIANQRAGSIIAKKHIKVERIMVYVDEDELIRRSELIIKGVVNRVEESRWSNEHQDKANPDRNVLQTDIAIKVLKVLKGTPYDGNEVVVRIDKGETDNKVVESEGYPDFKEGEEVILFLSIDDSDIAEKDKNYYVLTGMRQGKFTKDTATQVQFIQDLEEQSVPVNERLTICEEDIYKKLNDKNFLNTPKENEITEEERKENNKALFGE